MKTSFSQITRTLVLSTLVLALTQGLAPRLANAGGISEGSGDYRKPWHGAAWYLGQAPIRACIEISPDFGLSLAQAQADIRSAFSVWARYMKAKDLSAWFGPGGEDPRHSINAEVELLPACNGSQELTFFLGSDNSEIAKAKEQFTNPIAFVQRRNYDLASGRSNGFVWITKTGGVLPEAGPRGTPDWTMPYNFHGIALHEIGHLMGVPDISGTVMDEDWLISRFQDGNAEFRRVSFTKVDYLHEVLMLPTEKVAFNGFFGPTPCAGKLNDCAAQYKASFATLIGREHVGKVVTARFVGGNGSGAYLEVKDDAGAVKLKIEPNGQSEDSKFTLTKNVFKTYRDVRSGSIVSEGYSRAQAGSVEYRTLVTPSGNRYLAIIERNSSDPTALQVKAMIPKQGIVTIFVADPFQMPY
jgi:hypothetical protein